MSSLFFKSKLLSLNSLCISRKEKTMLKQMRCLLLIALLFCASSVKIQEVKAASAQVPVSVTVNGALVISDADNDTMAGENPTKNVNLTIDPDLGQTLQTASANFRVRTNRSTWRLTASKTASSAGGTGLTDADVLLDVSKSAGSNANASAGALMSPFTSQTNLSSLSTTAVDVISGTAKTSSAKDNSNTNNWFQVSTTYSVQPDFFYTPGTFSSTITYNLVSP